MSSTWGNNLKLSLFGESHGKGIGIIIDGLPPGILLDFNHIRKQMQRRAPGKSDTSTKRKEKDSFEIISGLFKEKTTGTPLCGLIRNENTLSEDYEKMHNLMRPGHADYTGYIKYKGFNDFRGGGHFSGRLTAPLVFAGAVAMQVLQKKNIYIGSHISDICGVRDKYFDDISPDENLFRSLSEKEICTIDDEAGLKMKEKILITKTKNDSVGGIIETAVINIPPGVGSPFFNSIESQMSSMMFSIPAVKGIEFGSGFNLTNMKGSASNDSFTASNGKIVTLTNHNGGIQGGISNGMPIIFRTVFKATPSISKKQKTIDIDTMKETEIEIRGRHDPCIVPRAVPVTEAVSALVILDILMEKDGI